MKTLLFLFVMLLCALAVGGLIFMLAIRFIAFCLSAWADMFRFEPSFKPTPKRWPEDE